MQLKCPCRKCITERERGRWRFYGEGPPFYGMELEVTTTESSAWDLARASIGELGEVGYDASVRGFELRTMPMSYAYFMENFPWMMLRDLRAMGCRILLQTNGMHIHVSREGFSGPAHTFRWLKFWYRNQEPIIRIARRHSDYGFFEPGARRGQFAHVRFRAVEDRVEVKQHSDAFSLPFKYRAGESWDTLNKALAKAEESDATTYDRYMAINTQNEDTFEVRLFGSTLRPRRAKAALGLVAGTLEYTRGLTVADITSGGWSWDRFSGWAEAQKIYQPLVQAIQGEV